MLDDEQIENFRTAFAEPVAKAAKPDPVPARPVQNPPKVRTADR